MLRFAKSVRRLLCLAVCLACLAAAVLPVSAQRITGKPQKPAEIPTAVIRRSASPSAEIIGCMANGTELTVRDKTKNYYRIDCYGMTGYIAVEQVLFLDGRYIVSCQPGSKQTRYLPVRDLGAVLEKRSQVLSLARKQLGVPYVWAGKTPRGFDCSGFTSYVMRNSGYEITSSSSTQMQWGLIISPDAMQPGDLLFFQDGRNVPMLASHVGIYIGDGKMIHAASGGITISEVSMDYYRNSFLCVRRVLIPNAASIAPVDTVLSTILTVSDSPITRSLAER